MEKKKEVDLIKNIDTRELNLNFNNKDINLIDDLSSILYLTGKAQNDLLRDL